MTGDTWTDVRAFLSVFGAIVFFGAFAVPLKSKRVQEARVDPLIFQLYYSFAIFLSSWLVLIYVPFHFTIWGIVGAAIWVPISILSLFAVQFIGMSVGCGVWCGITICVSFLWGALYFHDEVGNGYLAVDALVILIVGVAGVSMSNTSFVQKLECWANWYATDKPDAHVQEEQPLLNPPDKPTAPEAQRSRPLAGLLCAVALGCLNGSSMVPMRHAPPSASGVSYMPSFGIGCLVVTPVVVTVWFLAKRQMPQFHVRATALPGMITGCLWNVGNLCSIYATVYLGMTRGFPLTQLCLVVSGLLGIVVFREVTDRRSIIFWIVSTVVLLSGGGLLAIYG